MGNLLGEPFRKYVNNQVKIRQIAHGVGGEKSTIRNNVVTSYLNSRNAWVKFASAVFLEENRLDLLKKTGNPLVTNTKVGFDLAIQNVLFNGLTQMGTVEGTSLQYKGGFLGLEEVTNVKYQQQQRSGIVGNDRAYGVGGTDFGYSPMPGITSVNIKDLNRGSIKKATINITAHNRNQFDVIDILYLRLGYTVCLEFGNNIYLSEDSYSSDLEYFDKLNKVEDTLIDKYFWETKKESYFSFARKINEKREEYKGNYDGIIGVISNFNWSFESNGSYNITVEVTSVGDVIESLRVNLPPLIDSPSSPNAMNKYNAIEKELKKRKADESEFYTVLYPGLASELRRVYDILTNGQKLARFQYQISPNNKKKFKLNIPDASDELKIIPGKITDINGGQGIVKNSIISQDNQWLANFYDNGEVGGINLNPLNFTTKDIPNSYYSSPLILIFLKTGAGDDDYEIKVVKDFEEKDGKLMKPSWLDNRTNDLAKLKKIYGDNFEFYVVIGSGRTTLDNFEGNFVGTSTSTMTQYLATVSKEGLPVDKEESLNGVTKFYGDLTTYQKNLAFPIIFPFYSFKRKFYEDNILPSGGKEDDRFNSSDSEKEQSPLESFSERIETGKYKNKINNWFYEIRFFFELAFLKEKKDLSSKASETISKYLGLLPKIEIGGDNYSSVDDGGKESNKIIGYKLSPINSEISKQRWDSKVKFPPSSVSTCDLVKLDITPIEHSFFVRLGTLLQFIQDKIIMKVDGKYPFLKIDTDVKTNICYVIDNMVSTNIKKCLIKNPNFFTKSTGGENKYAKLFMGLEDFLMTGGEGFYRWGQLMNVYLNFNRIEEIFSSVDKNNQIALFDVLKAICNDINESLGNVNNIEPIIDKETNTVKFIDQTPIPGLDFIASQLGDNIYEERRIRKKEQEELIVFGYNNENNKSNFLRNVGMTTEISKNYATAITIGATSQGEVPGMEATAFSRWNIGVKDRFKNKLVDAESTETSSTSSLDEDNKSVIENYTTFINDKYVTLGLNYTSDNEIIINNDYISENKNTVKNYYIYAQAKTTEENYKEFGDEGLIESSIGFLPINLKLEMDGIGGIRIYDFVKVNTDFLPSNYPNTLEFICTGVNHKIENNEWITSLDTLATSISKTTP